MKPIDHIERALEAYLSLDTDERRFFNSLIKYAERLHAEYELAEPNPMPKRGRPPGSKNRKMVDITSQDDAQLIEKLYGNNGAVEEGL